MMKSVAIPQVAISLNSGWVQYCSKLSADVISVYCSEVKMENAFLHEYFDGLEAKFDDFLREAQRAGKSDEQIRILFELLPKLSYGTHVGKELVRLGLFSEVGYNACSNTLLNFICEKDVLLYAFTRPGPLLIKKDITQKGAVKYIFEHEDYEFISKNDYEQRLRVSELEQVLIHFARKIEPAGFERFRYAQYDETDVLKKDLFKEPISGQFKESDYLDSEIIERAELAGLLIQRFMSKEQLRKFVKPQELTDLTDGALYPLAFAPIKRCLCAIQ
ncbi:hypothetical protein FNU76_02740 [Chitinimonas arctica]|uniref:Uncharacterized protein n=1 Tax=Chitinimonas arctica TaxID=2594795 RepID=A0A516SB38_9NEIS|nr:hypothetical protein [Chitinimonas arctica]QDQ25356.1 hypothetical protein FNU76_02740 [Chitinimonas arctica]